jgi:branched-chain amino acid transport system permease protein
VTQRGRMLRLALYALVAVLLAIAPFSLNAFRIRLLTEVLIFGLFAASLDLLVGFTGLVSLGHALAFGVSAYTAGLIAIHLTTNAPLTLLAGIAMATLVSLVTGVLLVRSRGVYFLMLTLAFAQLGFSVAETWTPVTGGANGLPLPIFELYPGSTVLGNVAWFYYYALAAFVLGYLALRRVTESPFGRSLIGVRENEERMRSVGYSVAGYKLAAYCTAGAFAGYAGALYAQQYRFLSPGVVGFEFSALVFVMVVIGGRGTLFGPVLGAGVVLLLRDELSSRFEQWQLALGVVFILVVYFLPQGFGGLARLFGPRAARAGTP